MIDIKILVSISTILVGLFYNRHELKALWSCMRERDYINWYELNKTVARRELQI